MTSLKNLKLILGTFLFGLLGALVGYFGTGELISHRPSPDDMISVDGWYAHLDIGSPKASAWRRAFIAHHATFAVQSDEVLYLARRRDSQGEILRESCRYEITGRKLPAHWWSLTIYDDEGFLPDNKLENSVGAHDLASSPALWQIYVAPRPDSNSLWLPSLGAGHFNLLLRLYVPEVSVKELKNLPEIRRLDCNA